MRRGRPEYVNSGDSSRVIRWSARRGAWILIKVFRVPSPASWLFDDSAWGRTTLYKSDRDEPQLPLAGWEVVDGAEPPPAPTVTGSAGDAGLRGDTVPPEEIGKWVQINSSFACKQNADDPQVKPLTGRHKGSLADCMSRCMASRDCAAVDWFREDGECGLFPAGCTRPQEPGGSSWVLAADELHARACNSWSEHMEFMGQGWTTTDWADGEQHGAIALAETVAGVFEEACEDGDRIDMYYAEKDVGYDVSGSILAFFKNRLLQSLNDFNLFHSGVRFVGCGQSVMFQLQARAWGLSGKAFSVSLPYPVTAPDSRHVWETLNCSIPGRGARDVGAGNIIYYRLTDSSSMSRWSRGEVKVVSFERTDIGAFFRHIIPHFSWWNVVSKYYPESVTWRGQGEDKGTLLRPAIVCDTFSLWMLAQGLFFAKQKGYDPTSIHIGDGHPKYNQVDITIESLTEDSSLPRPRIGTPAQEGVSREYLRSQAAADKDSIAMWEVVKGNGSCAEVHDTAQRTTVFQRSWWDPATWSHEPALPPWSTPWSTPSYVCTERIKKDIWEADLVRFGPWRFFALGRGLVAMSLEWDAKAVSTYHKPFPIYDAGEIRLPEGTPRGPFGDTTVPNPCGKFCPWTFPVPPPPPGGYVLGDSQ